MDGVAPDNPCHTPLGPWATSFSYWWHFLNTARGTCGFLLKPPLLFPQCQLPSSLTRRKVFQWNYCSAVVAREFIQLCCWCLLRGAVHWPSTCPARFVNPLSPWAAWFSPSHLLTEQSFPVAVTQTEGCWGRPELFTQHRWDRIAYL